jgi:phospholipid transport system substrate-binding protein
MISRRTLLATAATATLTVPVVRPRPAVATPMSDGAAKFIQQLADEAIEALAKHVADMQQRFHDLFYQGFDVPYIARFVLGRYWNSATPEQQKDYERLFADMIVKVYSGRFSMYSGETLKVTGSRQETASDSIVNSQILRPSGPPVSVDWRVRDRGGDYKIIDVAVEGVSMGVTQRDEFSSVIQRGGGTVEALIKELRQRTGEL